MSGRRRCVSSSSSSASCSSGFSPSRSEDDSMFSSLSSANTLSSSYSAAVKNGLQTLKSDGLFSDITLKVGDKSIKCHKLILCTFSGYFRSMFQSGMKESKQSEVILEMLDPAAVEAVIDYMYTDDIGIESNAENILITVLYLQVESLKERCEEEMTFSVTPDSVFSIWKLTDMYTECTTLRKHCVKYSTKHFKQIIESVNFLDIDLQNLTHLLSHENLKVSNEDIVLLAVMKWVRHDQVSRISTLKEILPHVRMPLVSFVELDKLKEEFPDVMKGPALQYIQEAETYKREIARQMTISSSRTEYRSYHKKEKVLLLISGRKSRFSEPTRRMWCYSYLTNTWSKLAPVPETPQFGFATCTFGESELYLTMGENNSILYTYSGLNDKWKECPSVKHARAYHSMIAVCNSIYLIGGYEYIEVSGTIKDGLCQHIEAYNVCEELWRKVGELHTPLSGCISVVGPSDKVYIFGGHSGLDGQRSNIVQCFDTNTSTCSVITTDPGIRWVLRVTSCNGKIFVVDGGNIYNFITENNAFKKIGKRTNVLVSMGMVQKESQIIFVGGIGRKQEKAVQDYLDGKNAYVTKTSRDVVQYDLINGTECVLDISLPEHLTDTECQYLVVNKSILDCSFYY